MRKVIKWPRTSTLRRLPTLQSGSMRNNSSISLTPKVLKNMNATFIEKLQPVMDFELVTKVSSKAGKKTALVAKWGVDIDVLQKPGKHAKDEWFHGPDIQIRKHTMSRKALFDDCSKGARDKALSRRTTFLWAYNQELGRYNDEPLRFENPEGLTALPSAEYPLKWIGYTVFEREKHQERVPETVYERPTPQYHSDDDYWKIEGNWILRVHVRKRIARYTPDNSDCPVSVKELDRQRVTVAYSVGVTVRYDVWTDRQYAQDRMKYDWIGYTVFRTKASLQTPIKERCLPTVCGGGTTNQ